MRRKYAQPVLPTLTYKDGILSVPGYAFEKVRFPLLFLGQSEGRFLVPPV